MYNRIIVGGFEVTYRHRDTENVIKVAKITTLDGDEVEVPVGLDECYGQTFYEMLHALNYSMGDPELAGVKLVRFDR